MLCSHIMKDNNNGIKDKTKTEGVFSMDFLKNIAINLKATGPAAVIISWILSVSLVGILGHGEIASKALTVLEFVGPMLIIILGQKIT